MHYLGGKFRIKKDIDMLVRQFRLKKSLYWEPFLGGAWTFYLAEHPKMGSDLHLELISLYKAIQCGWEPPNIVSEEMYLEAKLGKLSPELTAFIGFGCSFSGKYFGGYARSGTRNYALNAKNSLLKKLPGLVGTDIFQADYKDVKIKNAVIYCDPPYEHTTQYKSVDSFDWESFWNWAREMSMKNIVLISSYKAPPDFKVLKEIPTKLDLHTSNKDSTRIERVFTL